LLGGELFKNTISQTAPNYHHQPNYLYSIPKKNQGLRFASNSHQTPEPETQRAGLHLTQHQEAEERITWVFSSIFAIFCLM